MRLVFRPAVPADFASGFDCIGDGFLYDPCSKKVLISMWADLIGRRMAIAACIEDLDKTFGRSIVAFSFSVFARPSFADEIHSGLHPYVPVRILERWRKFNVPLLSAGEIAIANARGGADLLMLHHGIPAELADSPSGNPIVDQSEAFMQYAVAGHRFRSILMETYGGSNRAAKLGMGYRSRASLAQQLATHGIQPRPHRYPYLVGIDRPEVAQMRGTTLASLFTYDPPTLGLSTVEQELLQFALGGNTDLELATLLCISYPTVRKRWESIYKKVCDRIPYLFDEPANPCAIGRGNEKRRPVLRYIQFHREELRPFAPEAASLVSSALKHETISFAACR